MAAQQLVLRLQFPVDADQTYQAHGIHARIGAEH